MSGFDNKLKFILRDISKRYKISENELINRYCPLQKKE